MRHRYVVGQMLDILPAPRLSNRPAGPCEVIACLPHDRGPLLYRVRSTNEDRERVIEETDLTPSRSVRTDRTVAETPFQIAVVKR